MDFFDSQDRARRKTAVLVAYYIAAVMLIIATVYLAFVTLLNLGGSEADAAAEALRLWEPQVFMLVTFGTLLVVLGGTAYKVAALSRGGSAVAKMLGGRPIARDTRDPGELKILNVVEEMAIASGVPVPPVYILDHEPGINAFAAGFKPEDAVIGVTRGIVDTLSRDELQGVVAHEFSHILHGDMRLNIRLMGVLHGILLIGLIGYGMMRSSMYAGRSRSSSRGGRGKSQGQIALLGLALLVIGYVGVFFAKLIKSAVSRQREFLADAAAVQFTRNPAGIAGALRKIADAAAGGRIENAHAEEASHLFFSNGLSGAVVNLMATHPPLKERIRRLDPYMAQDMQPASGNAAGGGGARSAAAAGIAGISSLDQTVTAAPAAIMASVGAPAQRHLDYASGVLAALPPELAAAARKLDGAQAVIYALLINARDTVKTAQISIIQGNAEQEPAAAFDRLAPAVAQLPRELRLPLADMAIATLKELSGEQYHLFRDIVTKLIVADESINIFEYTLHHAIQRHLEPFFHKPSLPSVRYHSIKPLLPKCADVLSCLAHWGDFKGGQAGEFFEAGIARLGVKRRPDILPREKCTVALLDTALTAMEQAAPAVKKHIMDACISCAAASGVVTFKEALMLRAVGDCLGCPVPPILAGTPSP